jgi:hypothetical protein
MSAVNSLTTFVLELRTDEYLELDELERESDKLVEAAGKDMADNFLVTFGTSVVNSACKTGTSLHGAMPLVDKIAVHRNELRMLKRGNRERQQVKVKASSFRFLTQFTSNTVNLAKNAVQGLARSEVNVDQMNRAYLNVGN